MKKLLVPFFVILFLTLIPAAHAQAAPGFTKISSQQSATTFVDGTCPLFTSCFYQVTAVDSAGHETAPATCLAAQACFGTNQAIAVMPSSGTHTVTVSWIAPTVPTGTVVVYNLYRAIGLPAVTGLAALVN